MQPIVNGVRSGMVAINDFAAYYLAQLPFGGVGGSGYGRFAGEEGLRGLCNIKSISEDRWGFLGFKTGIPPAFQYPVKDQQTSWRFAQGVVELGYGNLARKVNGVGKIIKNM